jgi:hypothetical protein
VSPPLANALASRSTWSAETALLRTPILRGPALWLCPAHVTSLSAPGHEARGTRGGSDRRRRARTRPRPPAMARPTRSRWVGRCRLMPQSLPPPRPFAVGRAPPLHRRTDRAVPSTAPAVPPRRRSSRWSSTTSRPSSPSRRAPTPWAGASRRGWSATFAATCGAASSPTDSRGFAAWTVGMTGSWPSPARAGGCAPPATHGAWRRWRPTRPTR